MKRLPIRDFRIKLLLLSLLHLVTDALCAYLVFAKLYPENPKLSFAVFIGYNLLAFVAQAPLGILIDGWGNRNWLFAASALMIVLGYLFSTLCLVAVFFIGFGNALFHIGGGKYVTHKSGNDVFSLGVFVSTGAIGLALGQKYFTTHGLVPLFLLLLAGCTLLMLFSEDAEVKENRAKYEGNTGKTSWVFLALVAVVFARSFVGKVVATDFQMTHHLYLVIAAATALGKAMGGVSSRLFGALPTVVASMSVAAACLTLGCGNPYSYILGVFAFNFSMPITLYYANIVEKGREGFAFGTLAAALAPGYLIAMLFSYSPGIKISVAALCFLSVLVITVISKRVKNVDRSVASDDSD